MRVSIVFLIVILPALVAVSHGVIGASLASTLENREDGVKSSITVLVTDMCDETYLSAFENHIGNLKLSVRGLNGLVITNQPNTDGIILLDPNWPPSKDKLAIAASESVVGYIERGGRVVATLNGVYFLERSLEERIPIRVMEFSGLSEDDIGMVPSSYNASRYKVLGLAGNGVEKQGSYYIIYLGKGYIVVIPYNLVWAYCDTGDQRYLSLLEKALTVNVPSASGSAKNRELSFILASAIIGLAAVSQSFSSSSSSNPRRQVFTPPLYWRIEEENVLDNPIRKKIIGILEKNKAVTMRELAAALGLSKSTVSWHLYILESRGLVSSFRWKKSLIYYPSGKNNVKSLFECLEREDKTFRQVLKMLSSGYSVEETARKLRLSASSVNEICKMLAYIGEAEPVGCRGS